MINLRSKMLWPILLCSTAEAMRITPGVPETCESNIQRMQVGNSSKAYEEHLGSGTLFRDNNFPASKSSLFWSHNLPEDAGKIQELYAGRIESWKRPVDIMNLK